MGAGKRERLSQTQRAAASLSLRPRAFIQDCLPTGSILLEIERVDRRQWRIKVRQQSLGGEE